MRFFFLKIHNNLLSNDKFETLLPTRHCKNQFLTTYLLRKVMPIILVSLIFKANILSRYYTLLRLLYYLLSFFFPFKCYLQARHKPRSFTNQNSSVKNNLHKEEHVVCNLTFSPHLVCSDNLFCSFQRR